MTPERWQQVKEIAADALELSAEEREEFVTRSAAGDEELCREVHQLIGAGDETGGSFLSENPYNARALFTPREALGPAFSPGEIICGGRFQILHFVSAGGMGEVFEAWDAELEDKVALKTIRPDIASDPAIIESFKREVKQARHVAQANVCRVYDLFCHESGSSKTWFLTMELLSGVTLLEHLRQHGPMPATEALDIVEQITAGLAASHGLGIIHRDFKSNNVMLVPSENGKPRAVIMDFGLALTVDASRAAEGSAAGTPDYMAPEQRSGGAVTCAADVYAFGVVICEMRTGERRPGPGALEPRWERVVRRCMEARPEDRFGRVEDVVVALDPRRRRIIWARRAGVIAAAALVVGALVLGYSVKPGSRLRDLQQITGGTDLSGTPAISRDGKMIAYDSDRGEAGNLDIWVQQLAGGPARRITTDPAEDLDPSLSADGSKVVFRSEREGGGIYIASTADGHEHLLVTAGRNPRFSPDSRQIAYWSGDQDDTIASGRLYWMPATGGPARRLAQDFVDARFPVWSADGRFLLFRGCRSARQPLPACAELWVTSLAGDRLVNTGAFSLLRAENIELNAGLGDWVGDRLVFSGLRDFLSAIFELKLPQHTMKAEGKPRTLASERDNVIGVALADDRSIVFGRITAGLHIWGIKNASNPAALVAYKVTDSPGLDVRPNVSPNGRWLAFARRQATNWRDIWVKDLQSGLETPFFKSDFDKPSALVNDAGDSIVYEERMRDIPSIAVFQRNHRPKVLCTGCSVPTAWFNHQRAFFYTSDVPQKIMLMDLPSATGRTALSKEGVSLSDTAWSEQTEYLLFTAFRDAAHKQVLALSYPVAKSEASGPWIPITSELEWSDRPQWSGDGRVIFYRSTRDGFSCIWGQRFDPNKGVVTGPPFGVRHYHDQRMSPARVVPWSFGIAASGDTVFLTVAETRESVWTGKLAPPRFFVNFFPYFADFCCTWPKSALW